MGAAWKQRIISAAGKHLLVSFLFFLFLLTVDWTLFSAFSFLEREDKILSQHWFGIVPKAQSVLHCHCVFKLFKIKTVPLGNEKKWNVMRTLRQAMRCSYREALKSGQPTVRNEVLLTSLWQSLQADSSPVEPSDNSSPQPTAELQSHERPSWIPNSEPVRW